MGHTTCHVFPPSLDPSQLQSNSSEAMFLNTILCIPFVPSGRVTSRASVIWPSLNSPTKSRYPPSLSTQVCFHLPALVSKIDTLSPRRCISRSPEKFSSTTQPSSTRRMLFDPCCTSPALFPGQVKSHSPTQKSSWRCSLAAHGFGGALPVC